MNVTSSKKLLNHLQVQASLKYKVSQAKEKWKGTYRRDQRL